MAMDDKLDGFAVMRRNGEIYTVAVDPEDYQHVMAAGPWFIQPDYRTFYAMRSVKRPDGRRTTQKLHQLLLGSQVDHIDGNGLNNTRANLRFATHSQNCQNQRVRKDSKSGVRGVSWDNANGKWRAQLQVAGKDINLGRHATLAEAAAVVSRARALRMPYSADARGGE